MNGDMKYTPIDIHTRRSFVRIQIADYVGKKRGRSGV